MIRLFETHTIRPYQELSGLWTMIPQEGEMAGREIPVMVPGCWEQIPGLENYQGRALYRKNVYCSGCVRLVFKGISHTADIFWDGEPVAHHYNAYTSFDVVLGEILPGEHTLEVLVDNRFGPESALHIPNDYQTYGGIIRPVVMENVGDMYIQWVHAVPEKRDGQWKLLLKALVKSRRKESTAIRLISHIAGQEILWPEVEIGEEAVLETVAVVKAVEEYLPEHPKLYLLNTNLYMGEPAIDDLTERVGFREIRISGSHILWNGRPSALRVFAGMRIMPCSAAPCPWKPWYRI